MDDLMLNFFEQTFNYKKLRKSREKRGYTLKYVSEQTGIPAPTIQRYEDGTIQKVPLDAIKKISEVYKTDYKCYYGWSTFPFLGSMSGILFSLLSGISLENIHNGALIGLISGFTAMLGGSALYNKLSKKRKEKNDSKIKIRELIYNNLTKDEREKYNEFKTIAKTLLKTNEMPDIEDETDDLLFTVYLLHNVRKKMGTNVFKYIDPRALETLDEEIIKQNIEKITNENKNLEYKEK